MNITELFEQQIAGGATDNFFYGLESPEPYTINIMRYKDTLDTFPANLEFVRMLNDRFPLFRSV